MIGYTSYINTNKSFQKFNNNTNNIPTRAYDDTPLILAKHTNKNPTISPFKLPQIPSQNIEKSPLIITDNCDDLLWKIIMKIAMI